MADRVCDSGAGRELVNLLHDFFGWLASVPGSSGGDPTTSWSQQLAGSLHYWAVLEATHVLTLMLFAGTILIVDLRMLGVAFRTVPFSELAQKVLPLTVVGFALLLFTGAFLFFANPVVYYHSVWFRAKFVFLLIASVNIFWFHARIQRRQADWDSQPNPPGGVKLAALISLISWTFVIVFGRLIAFTWFSCENMPPASFGYAFAECASEMREAIEADEAEAAGDESGDAPPKDPPPVDSSPDQPAPDQPADGG